VAGAVVCTGQVVSAAAPVTLATTIACTATYQISIAARSTADEAFVAFSTAGALVGDVQLASISPTGVSVEQTGIAANMVDVIVDASDAPNLIGSEIANRGVAWFVRSGTGWQSEMVSPVPTDPYTFYQASGEAFGADGQLRILYAGSMPAPLPLVLAQRSSTSGWSATQIATGDSVPAGMAIDSAARTRVVYRQPGQSSGIVLDDWPEGLPVRQIATDPSGTSYPLGVAAGLSGMLGVGEVTAGGVRVVFSDGMTAAREQATPDGATPPSTCALTAACQSGTCTMDVLTPPLALAATSDGAFWLAYGVDHIDRDTTSTISTGEGHICMTTVTADRSTEEVILVRATADGSTPPSIRWRFSTPFGSLTQLALAARGSRLDLALSERLIRTFAFDWQRL
jgi:hypothetical protein